MANAAECIARSIRVSEGTERHALHPFRRFHPAGIGKYVDLQSGYAAAFSSFLLSNPWNGRFENTALHTPQFPLQGLNILLPVQYIAL